MYKKIEVANLGSIFRKKIMKHVIIAPAHFKTSFAFLTGTRWINQTFGHLQFTWANDIGH